MHVVTWIHLKDEGAKPNLRCGIVRALVMVGFEWQANDMLWTRLVADEACIEIENDVRHEEEINQQVGGQCPIHLHVKHQCSLTCQETYQQHMLVEMFNFKSILLRKGLISSIAGQA